MPHERRIAFCNGCRSLLARRPPSLVGYYLAPNCRRRRGTLLFSALSFLISTARNARMR